MGKKHKESCSATDDDPKTKKHKKSSTSTHQDKKFDQQVFQEIKEIKKSIQELSETMNKIQELLLTKTHLMYFSSKEKETEEEINCCCFASKYADGNNYETIFVKGFEKLRPKHEIKNALSNFFSSCGEAVRVFVPYECQTSVPLGFAFVNLKDGKGIEKALELNGSLMGGKELEVVMAWRRSEFNGYTNFSGCKDCFKNTIRLNRDPEYDPSYPYRRIPTAFT